MSYVKGNLKVILNLVALQCLLIWMNQLKLSTSVKYADAGRKPR